MPICPGCERTVSYKTLQVHERHCTDLWDGDGDAGQSLERLDHRLEAIEHLLKSQIPEAEMRELDSRVREPEQRHH